MTDEEYIPDEHMGFPRIDPIEVEEGMRVQILYNSTFGSGVYREGTVTERKIVETGTPPLLRIEVRHAEHRATIVGGRLKESLDDVRGSYGVSSESPTRTTSVGRLIAMYHDPESG